MENIIVFGASGFIGKYLIDELSRSGKYRIKAITGSPVNQEVGSNSVEFTSADLLNPDTLKGILETGCIVINLVYIWDSTDDNFVVIKNLLDTCKTARIKLLIHCSTAAVTGRISGNIINEDVHCNPVTQYGITKLGIENIVLEESKGNYNAVILRPTSVYGPGGEPLKKLANDLLYGMKFKNYLKSCLFGKRRMNLVHVKNVVASIMFLIKQSNNFNNEIFNVSDDDEPMNNFIDVEKKLMRQFNLPDYIIPRCILPKCILKFLLLCLGRNNINPDCNYSQEKLNKLGFNKTINLDSGLHEFTNWYRATHDT